MSITREDLKNLYLEIERQKKISKIEEIVDKIKTIVLSTNSSGRTTCHIRRPFVEEEYTQAVIDELKKIFVDTMIYYDGPENIKIDWTLLSA